MGPSMYLYEKVREEHYQDLRRETEKRRLLAHLPRQDRQSRALEDNLMLKAGPAELSALENVSACCSALYKNPESTQ